jgi:ketosteroid isomerase-like protein
MKTPREVSDSYWQADMSHDLERILAHYHHDAVFHPASGPPRARRDPHLLRHEQQFLGMDVKIVHEVTQGDESALAWEIVLTDKQGQQFPVRGVNVVHVSDGKFTSVRSYYDPTQFPVPSDNLTD